MRNNKILIESDVLEIGNVIIDPKQFLAIVDGKKVSFPRKEFQLLYLLASNPERTFERKEILDEIWEEGVLIDDHTIAVHIRKIRKKLGVEFISTVKRIGYRLG